MFLYVVTFAFDLYIKKKKIKKKTQESFFSILIRYNEMQTNFGTEKIAAAKKKLKENKVSLKRKFN